MKRHRGAAAALTVLASLAACGPGAQRTAAEPLRAEASTAAERLAAFERALAETARGPWPTRRETALALSEDTMDELETYVFHLAPTNNATTSTCPSSPLPLAIEPPARRRPAWPGDPPRSILRLEVGRRRTS
jgi:hypothetical protein